MTTRSPFHRLVATASVLALALALPAASTASELGVALRSSGFVVHDADETLRNYCRWEGDKLLFVLPGGASYELVTSTDDPAITNQGDGAFHPYDPSEVKRALDAVRFPVHRLGAEIFLLPYPRRLNLDSAAGPGLVLLSPGVRPLPVELQHAEFAHELGHIVQYAMMPDSDGERWNEYRQLRGISDTQVYSASAVHHDRPHEIFAEDFRVLCGDPLANYSGTIENSTIAYSTQVGGLAQFVVELGEAPMVVASLGFTGDGHRGAVAFSRGAGAASPLDVFDVTGRRIAVVLSTDGARWLWDGRDASGRAVAPGVVFARARDGLGGAVRLIRL